ncbi:hypothetical protein AMJ74_00200 [candidate division WOR_3 bacterium SM1_77]|uniref:N-acetyltransferase domain-containing protein n=1 Tax=candidate division WOR_3 bacterium SM1_77 TaxID=1703778 RepID=A0A0S8K214_UNCW3|nr:MAG: hypothetical protein AMJ74_00200 [candidate division WOR_3 bacterium SM1_77]
MNHYELKSMKKEHLEDAARLFADNYRTERGRMPILPPRYENHNTVLPLLGKLIQKAPGVVALKNGNLSGYLIGQLLPAWRGRRSTFVPFWAHAVTGKKRRMILQYMYAHLSSNWTANGCFTHLISVLANDKEMLDTLFWFGFGMAVIDSIRDFSDLQSPLADIEVRRASLDDLEIILLLSQEFRRYMAGPPIFMPLVEKSSKKYNEKWLSNPANALWLGLYKKEAVAYMEIGSLNEDYVITDEKTVWIQGAYTKEHLRGKGFGAALLKCALDWAQAQGYEKCAVDFEGENILASAFWLRHFRPTCFSLVRQVDERIGWAHKDRADEHFW